MKLKENPNLISQNQLESFYGQLSSSTSAKLADINLLFENYFEQSIALSNSLSTYYGFLSNYSDLLEDYYLDTTQVTILEQLSNLNNQIGTSYVTVQNDLVVEEFLDSIIISQINQALQTISTTSAILNTEKEMCQLLLSNLSDTSFMLSNSELNQVRSIASACPFTDGYGVYVARNLLPRNEQIVHDDTDCELNQYRIHSTSVSNTKTSIYPNPVYNELIVNTDKDWLSYTIYDLNGKNYQSGKISNNIVQVNKLRSGIYILKLVDLDGFEHIEKFSKILY